jgi:hypothetical protein
MKAFDDFDIQVQSDEIIPEEFEADMRAMDRLVDWYFSPWDGYRVDCDDGTHGDVIYEWAGYVIPSS